MLASDWLLEIRWWDYWALIGFYVTDNQSQTISTSTVVLKKSTLFGSVSILIFSRTVWKGFKAPLEDRHLFTLPVMSKTTNIIRNFFISWVNTEPCPKWVGGQLTWPIFEDKEISFEKNIICNTDQNIVDMLCKVFCKCLIKHRVLDMHSAKNYMLINFCQSTCI